MLLEIAAWLHSMGWMPPLFGYLTFRGILGALTALLLSLWLGPYAIARLAKLKGVGPATASAVLAAARPDVYPFFDEIVAARLPGLGEVAWTLGYYGRYAEALRGEAERLGGDWTPAALERALWSYPDETVTHGDLRLDNIVIDDAGAAWLCDWAWPCRGPAGVDTASLLVTARASGLDADTLFATHPTAATADSDALDAALAALSGHWLVQADAGELPAARAHHVFSGTEALSWLAARRGWG